jgi:hypothetical protein
MATPASAPPPPNGPSEALEVRRVVSRPTAMSARTSAADLDKALASLLHTVADLRRGLDDADAVSAFPASVSVEASQSSPAAPASVTLQAPEPSSPPSVSVWAPPADDAVEDPAPAPLPRKRRRRRLRRFAFGLALPVLFVAGVLVLPSARWFDNVKSRLNGGPSGGSGTLANASFVTGRHAFGWAPVPKATYYRVRFFRAGQEVFQAKPAGTRVVLPPRWRFAGRAQRLTAGTYRWVVEPGFGARRANRYGAAVVSAEWVAGP